MIVEVIFPIQAIAGLFPLAVVWIGGGCAIYFIGGQSLRTYGQNANYKSLRLIGIIIQNGSVFAFLYFVGVLVLMVISPLEISSKPFGQIAFYSAFFAPGMPIVFGIIYYSFSKVRGRELVQ